MNYPSYLTSLPSVIGLIGVFIFYSFALLRAGSWIINKNKRTGLRAISLFVLALGSLLYALDFDNLAGIIGTYVGLLGGLTLLILSYVIIKRIPRPTSNLVDADKKQVVKKINTLPSLPKKPSNIITPQRPATARPAPAAVKTTPSKEMPETNVGLRSNAFLKLPRRQEKGVKYFFNTAIGLIVIVLIGWGGYAGYQKLFGSKNTQRGMLEESNFIKEYANTDPIFEAESPPADTEPIPKENEEEPTPTPKPATLTIKETETGYLNVRDGAGTIFEIITTISPGDTVELLDEDKSWYKVKTDDDTAGWISGRYADKNE